MKGRRKSNIFTPEIVAYNDYYPGGMAMPNRQIINGQPYRYGYQGEFAETDPETGKPAFQLRIYDPRINRWLSPDPYGQHASPYMSMGNNWANKIDPDGGFDWYTDADGNYVYDSNLTADNASSFLGAGETYVGESFFDFSTLQSGSIDGVMTNLIDGSQTQFLDAIEISNVKYLDIYRDTQTSKSTTSTFTFGNISGYILEPAGPDTTTPNQDRRIPEGIYNLVSHSSKKYPSVFKVYNDDVSQSRAILIHAGNKPSHTLGCLLPGCSRGTDRVNSSRTKLTQLRNAINAVGVKNVRLRIHNQFPINRSPGIPR